jgi:hypothetical protein
MQIAYERGIGVLVLATAGWIAIAGSRDYAGGWNDGSRLATVETLVDHHTQAIDDSIFVKVPSGPGPGPYPADKRLLNIYGTGDKLRIAGHYYSDKSPVPALLMAGVYRIWQAITGKTAREQPDRFCYAMTLLSSGLAYVAAVGCIFWTTGLVGLRLGQRLLLTAGFGLATVALPYAVHVNNHILLLAVTAALLPGLVKMTGAQAQSPCGGGRLLGLGALAGLGYTIDLGAGPVLLACTLGLVVWCCRRWGSMLLFLLAALPWMAVHHVVNYAVGGTWQPANAVPEYFQWPGSIFAPHTLTGAWHHDGPGAFLTYAAALLVGRHGFLCHNLPLFAALAVMVWYVVPVRWWGRRFAAPRGDRAWELPVVFFACFFSGGVWLAYALTSTNYAGQCCSIRWFVPLLAPAYLVLALFLRRRPDAWGDVLLLSGWGLLICVQAWRQGTWVGHLVPFFWPIQVAALVSWAGYRAARWGRRGALHFQGQGTTIDPPGGLWHHPSLEARSCRL